MGLLERSGIKSLVEGARKLVSKEESSIQQVYNGLFEGKMTQDEVARLIDPGDIPALREIHSQRERELGERVDARTHFRMNQIGRFITDPNKLELSSRLFRGESVVRGQMPNERR